MSWFELLLVHMSWCELLQRHMSWFELLLVHMSWCELLQRQYHIEDYRLSSIIIL